MRFIKQTGYDNTTYIKIEMAIHEEATLNEVLAEFQNFLRACGYTTEYNKY